MSHRPVSGTRLAGRWRAGARAVWVAAVSLAVSLWLLGSYAYAMEPPPEPTSTISITADLMGKPLT